MTSKNNSEEDKGYEETKSDSDSERDNISYWLKWLPGAKKAAKRHHDDSKAAWSEYLNNPEGQDNRPDWKDDPRSYPIYLTSCLTLEPAYYSRTPDLTTRRRFNINDAVARTASIIVERLGEYHKENSNFDEVMCAARGDYIHAAKATTQVVYEADIKKVKAQVPLFAVEGTEEFLRQDGTPWDGEVFAAPDGLGFFGEEEKDEADPATQKIYLSPACYDEVLHTPDAKTQFDIKDMAYYFCMPREEAEKRFGKSDLPWKAYKSFSEEDRNREHADLPGEYIDGWECYSKVTKRVYWVCEGYKEGFLDMKDDPYGFKNFFPSPAFIIQSKPPKNLFPTPMYIHLAPTIRELHSFFRKIFNLVEAIRRRALVDGDNEDLVDALMNRGDNEFVAVKNLASLIEKGGMDKLIWYLPVEELVSAISELNVLEEKFKNLFYEWFGVPDILRGISDPQEAEGTQEIKSTAAHDRFKNDKKNMRRLARDSLEMMIDLALQVYSDEKIAQIAGYEFMEPEHQQYFVPALQMLRNDESRNIRIDIETDSMSYMDEEIRQKKRNAAAQTIMGGLKELPAMLQVSVPFGTLAMKLILLTLDGMDVGKEFEDGIKNAFQELIDMQQQQAQQPPPPDPMMIKTELENSKAQMQNMQKMRELDQKEMKMMLDEKDREFKRQLEDRIQSFIEIIETQRVKIDEFQATINAMEQKREEDRLAIESISALMNKEDEGAEEESEEPVTTSESSEKKGGDTIIINAPGGGL